MPAQKFPQHRGWRPSAPLAAPPYCSKKERKRTRTSSRTAEFRFTSSKQEIFQFWKKSFCTAKVGRSRLVSDLFLLQRVEQKGTTRAVQRTQTVHLWGEKASRRPRLERNSRRRAVNRAERASWTLRTPGVPHCTGMAAALGGGAFDRHQRKRHVLGRLVIGAELVLVNRQGDAHVLGRLVQLAEVLV